MAARLELREDMYVRRSQADVIPYNAAVRSCEKDRLRQRARESIEEMHVRSCQADLTTTSPPSALAKKS